MIISYKRIFFSRYLSEPHLWLANVVRHNWKLGVTSIIFGLFASILEGLTASLVLPLTGYLTSPNNNAKLIPVFFRKISSSLNLENSFVVFIFIFWILVLLKNLTKYWSDFNINKLRFFTGRIIRKEIITKYIDLDLSFYNSARTGELTALVNDHAERSQMACGQFFSLISEFATVLCLFIVATYLSPSITLVSITSFCGLVFFLKPLLSKIKAQSRHAAMQATQFSGLVTEILDGIKIIKSFGLEVTKFNESEYSLDSRCSSDIKLYQYGCIVFPLTEALGISVLLIVLTTFFLWNGSNNILPTLLTYVVVMLRTLPRINQINNIISQFSIMEGSLCLICNFLSDESHQKIKTGSFILHAIKKDISIQNLTFQYPGSDSLALKNITLSVKYGQKIALVGQSGSGKSTLVDLLMRFYDPTSGFILIDGKDLKELNLINWRSKVAIVSQDTFLFNGTVLDNVRYGNLSTSNERIREAIENAYAMEFIEDLPLGLNTIVGQRGVMLSGGQKQRIAIARAFLRDPQLLILDEATSALDTASEVFVQKAINRISEGRTVITIAHRLSTIQNADVIVAMKSGQIIEQGTHEQLLANKNQYWTLYNSHVVFSS